MSTVLDLTGVPGLTDWKDMQDARGNVRDVIEILEKSTPIVNDIPFMEGNLADGLETTVRTGLPRGTWRNFNEGVEAVKSARASMKVTSGMLETYNQVDARLARLGGMENALRGDEASATMQGLVQDMAEAFIYSDEQQAPKQFFGLQSAYNDLDTDATPSAENVIDMGGREAGKQQSIYLVGWGNMAITGFVPMGSPAGLRFQDLGEQTAVMADGKMLQVLRANFQWDVGLAVRDWRYCVRIANCGRAAAGQASVLYGAAFEDPTQMGVRGGNTQALVDATRIDHAERHSDMYAYPDIMERALDLIPSEGRASLVFYMRRDALSALRTVLKRSVGASTLTVDMLEGRPKYSFAGVPIRILDTLRNTEPVLG